MKSVLHSVGDTKVWAFEDPDGWSEVRVLYNGDHLKTVLLKPSIPVAQFLGELTEAIGGVYAQWGGEDDGS